MSGEKLQRQGVVFSNIHLEQNRQAPFVGACLPGQMRGLAETGIDQLSFQSRIGQQYPIGA
jgi:hypothetical protein